MTVHATEKPAGLLDRVVAARGSVRAIALMRVLVGGIVIVHLWPEARSTVLPVERFHVPWWSWLPVPSPGEYRVLLWIGVAAGAAMLVGAASRLATVVAFAVVSYLLFVDMTGFAHNRAFLVWLLFGLCLVPDDRSFSLIGRWSGKTVADADVPLWPVFLMRIVVSSVYITSGATKLLDPDWRGGLVLWDRVVRHQQSIPFDGWVHDVLTSRAFHHALSPAAIVTELLIGFGLWARRARLAAIWVAVVFHTSIELTASVQTFSYSALAALLLWVTPSVRDRTLVASRRLHRIVARLDWLARFVPDPGLRAGSSAVVVGHRVPPATGAAPSARAPTVLVDRDGTMRHGRDAELTALSRLPLLFPVVGPLLAVHRLRQPTRSRS